MSSEENKAIGARIRAIRLWRGLSAKALGEKIGVSENRILRIETGGSPATAPEIKQLAGALNVVASNLIGDVPLIAEVANG